ncbi:MAG: hypothetical protein D6704_00560 [Nitrospirae bacterium]|nr:MAG: hypothetical protein D6704_00560 [Nitrospirota bacterium]
MTTWLVRYPFLLLALVFLGCLTAGGVIWATTRYTLHEDYRIPLRSLSSVEYPENPEPKSRFFGRYKHSFLHLHHLIGTRYRLVLETDSHSPATPIELSPLISSYGYLPQLPGLAQTTV